MKKNRIILIGLILIGILIFTTEDKVENVEDANVVIGAGFDISSKSNKEAKSIIPLSVYLFDEAGEEKSVVKTGTSNTYAGTRESRQLTVDKKTVLGLEQIYVIGENQAEYGIRGVVDILFKNPNINSKGYFIVCKGKSKDLLQINIEGYSSSATYIQQMISNSNNYNFFGDKYNVEYAYIMIDGEGRSLAVPYIEVKDNIPQISGMALFNKDKLVKKIDMKDTRIMNLLRENNVKGILTIQDSYKSYINYYAKSKRTVKCKKNNGKYYFTINLQLRGDVISNEMYMNLTEDKDLIKNVEEVIAKEVKSQCDDFILRMKNEYKLDCLQLGWVAVGHYGRGTGVDWNDIISNSDINVNVDVNIDNLGRGNY